MDAVTYTRIFLWCTFIETFKGFLYSCFLVHDFSRTHFMPSLTFLCKNRLADLLAISSGSIFLQHTEAQVSIRIEIDISWKMWAAHLSHLLICSACQCFCYCNVLPNVFCASSNIFEISTLFNNYPFFTLTSTDNWWLKFFIFVFFLLE